MNNSKLTTHKRKKNNLCILNDLFFYYRVEKKGFTLVELLISISILSIAILASFTAVSNNIRGSNFASDQITAYYLADEGIEYIKNLRDQNGINNIKAFSGGSTVNWLAGIAEVGSDPCFNKNCVVDSPNDTLLSCSGGHSTCPDLLLDSVSGLFGYGPGWNDTQFKRSITVSITSSTEALITSTVSWNTNGIDATYSLKEIIMSWQ